MATYAEQVNEAAEWILAQAPSPPRVGLLAGTGLGDFVDEMEVCDSFSYDTIPNFSVSTVAGHHGRLLVGTHTGHPAVAMQGRFHLYEGYSVGQATFGIRVMQALGVKVLITANATGGLNPSFSAGDVMLIEDHLNLTGRNPLVGPNEDEWGPRFPEMTEPYDRALAEAARKSAAKRGITLRRGVYAGLVGPSLETPAEMRFLRTIGADVVGFSVVNEVICARHGGMRVLGFAAITNMNVPERLECCTLDDILQVAGTIAPKVATIVKDVLKGLTL